MKLPVIPKEMYKSNPLMTVAFISYSLVLYVGAGIGAAYIINSNLTTVVKLLALVPIWIVAQQGLHLLGILGHEGFHGNLHHNRIYSAMLGSFFSSMAASYLVTGYALTHWNHHKNTNKATDPDTEIYSRYYNFWNRFLFSRFAGTKKYRKDTYSLAFGKPIDLGASPFKLNVLRRLAQWNIVFAACWFAVYLSIVILWPMVGLVSIFIPHMLASGFSGLRAYIEHSGTTQDRLRNTRSYTSPLYTILFFGTNFHLEHHFYPQVPCYRLPRVHKWLQNAGFFANEECLIDSSILGPWQYVLSKHQYPSGLEQAKVNLSCETYGANCLQQ
ncbi:MAG: fatty acid desaturase [Moorea sp. SIO3G5]|nr:fatty acid desaturase [Moorena sp. SIO3G5]